MAAKITQMKVATNKSNEKIIRNLENPASMRFSISFNSSRLDESDRFSPALLISFAVVLSPILFPRINPRMDDNLPACIVSTWG